MGQRRLFLVWNGNWRKQGRSDTTPKRKRAHQNNYSLKYELNWAYGVSIEKLEEDIKAMKNLGVTEVEIDVNVSYDCAELTIIPIQRRLEKDEECEQRIEKIKLTQAQNKIKELRQLAILKEKYES